VKLLPEKSPRWKQPTPVDQLVVLRNSLEGEISNYDDGITTHTEMIRRTTEIFEEMRMLEFFLRRPELWCQ